MAVLLGVALGLLVAGWQAVEVVLGYAGRLGLAAVTLEDEEAMSMALAGSSCEHLDPGILELIVVLLLAWPLVCLRLRLRLRHGLASKAL